MRYVESGPPGMHRFTALFRGMYQNDSAGGHPLPPLVAAALMPLTQRDWVKANVRTGQRPLGGGYPIVPHNPASAHNTRGVKKGHTDASLRRKWTVARGRAAYQSGPLGVQTGYTRL